MREIGSWCAKRLSFGESAGLPVPPGNPTARDGPRCRGSPATPNHRITRVPVESGGEGKGKHWARPVIAGGSAVPLGVHEIPLTPLAEHLVQIVVNLFAFFRPIEPRRLAETQDPNPMVYGVPRRLVEGVERPGPTVKTTISPIGNLALARLSYESVMLDKSGPVKVEVLSDADVEGQIAAIALRGPGAVRTLTAALGADLDVARPLAGDRFEVVRASRGGHELWVARGGYAGGDDQIDIVVWLQEILLIVPTYRAIHRLA